MIFQIVTERLLKITGKNAWGKILYFIPVSLQTDIPAVYRASPDHSGHTPSSYPVVAAPGVGQVSGRRHGQELGRDGLHGDISAVLGPAGERKGGKLTCT